MAPSRDEWLKLSEDERRRVVAQLPDEVTDAEMSPPEGDLHFRGKVDPLESSELIVKLEGMIDQVTQRLADETRRREEETRRREAAERRIADLEAELRRK